MCVQWRWFSDNIWHDVVPAVLDDGMTAVTMGCGPPQCSDVSLHLYFPNANITWGIENVRVVVHMALAFWGCWGNMSLEMPTYEYNYHIHSRAPVDNLTHYHVGSLGTMILSDKVSMLFTFRAFLFGHVSNVWLHGAPEPSGESAHVRTSASVKLVSQHCNHKSQIRARLTS